MIALGTAIDYLNSLDRHAALNHELGLMEYASLKLSELEGVKLIGTAPEKASVVSFVIIGFNALDVGMYLDTMGVAVRTGHHCTEPVMDRFGIQGTIRAYFMFYNTYAEADELIEGVKTAIALLK